MKWIRNWFKIKEYKVLLKHYQKRVDTMHDEDMNKHVKRYLINSVKKYQVAIARRSK